MPFHRQRFDLTGGASPFSVMGPPVSGAIMQIAWRSQLGDTGADLAIDVLPSDLAGDTGLAVTLFADQDCLGSPFLKAPRQPTHAVDGSEAQTGMAPVVVDGRLRVRVTPGGNAVSGKLDVYIDDGVGFASELVGFTGVP